ncbi:hypothetical protein GCM10022267_83550 [Lentzea roselyniae]|uniref:Uncharacterized protein n=1 Tax=Lentzea roselyniae TaxID=531940 RepID=A0ABP7C9E6_9PSEU
MRHPRPEEHWASLAADLLIAVCTPAPGSAAADKPQRLAVLADVAKQLAFRGLRFFLPARRDLALVCTCRQRRPGRP